MYKTVRHGENSLQYTILPQTEEVLSNSGLKGKGRDYSPSIHVRRSRRKSTVKYVLLIIFGMIVALGLASIIPIYVMNGALFSGRNQQDHHETVTLPVTAPLATAVREMAKSRKKELKISPGVAFTLGQKFETSNTTTPRHAALTAAPSEGPDQQPTTPPWTMPALRSWKSSTSSTTFPPIATNSNEIAAIGTSSSSVRDHGIAVKPWEKDIIIRPTVTPERMTIRKIIQYHSNSFAPSEKSLVVNTKAFDDVLITTKGTTTKAPETTQLDESKFKELKDDILSAEDGDETLEVDEVFSLPPLKPDSASPENDSDEVTMSKTGNVGWYGARWPFVDTSSIQWTAYTLGGNLLLPLAVAALCSGAVVLLLAVAVRRHRRTRAACAHIGKLTADLQAGDDTTLLTAENTEGAEE